MFNLVLPTLPSLDNAWSSFIDSSVFRVPGQNLCLFLDVLPFCAVVNSFFLLILFLVFFLASVFYFLEFGKSDPHYFCKIHVCVCGGGVEKLRLKCKSNINEKTV